MVQFRANLVSYFVLVLLGSVVSISSLKVNRKMYDVDDNMVLQVMKSYFPVEDYLYVVHIEADTEEYIWKYHVPVVLSALDTKFLNYDGTRTGHFGYVFMTSNAANLEVQTVPVLKYLTLKSLKIKTRYILFVDLSQNVMERMLDVYSSYFHNLWKTFGIINCAFLPVHAQNVSDDIPFVFTYNPFLAQLHAHPKSLIKNTASQDLRMLLSKRVHTVHGYPLKAVFVDTPRYEVTYKDLRERKTLGNNPIVLFKQVLESHLNTTFDIYEPPDNLGFGTAVNGTETGLLGEIASGQAEYAINWVSFSIPDWSSPVQPMKSSMTLSLLFVVPRAQEVESWRLYQYMFQWKVSVGLGLTLLLLIGVTVLFAKVLSKHDSGNDKANGRSEAVSVLKAFLSVSINRLPTTHSQRLLIALSSLLGLIIISLISAKLFALMKSKPRSASIETFDDLYDSKLPIYYNSEYFKSTFSSDILENTQLRKLKDQFGQEETHGQENLFDPNILNISHRALMTTDVSISIIVDQPRYKSYLQYFEVLKEVLYKSSYVTILSTGSVYFERFNDLNLRVEAGGFWDYWCFLVVKKTFDYVVQLKNVNQSAVTGGSSEADDGCTPLTYNDLKMAFYTLYIGLTVSAACFLAELCKAYADNRHHLNN